MNMHLSGLGTGDPASAVPHPPASHTRTMPDFNLHTPFSDASSESMGAASHHSTTPKHPSVISPSDVRSGSHSAKRRGRKGHTKSRKGCFNCKRARIKCKENRPSCDYCAHRGLNCEWPDMQVNLVGALIRNTMPPVSEASPSIPFSIQPETPVFNMQDFRFFHHFIDSAYPHHPIGSASVWKHEIPSIASKHDYLLHGMLALAASDLAEHYPESSRQLSYTAMSHRVQAITSLNAAISAGLQNFEQGNAMLATCFALVFQSVLIEDGLADFMNFIRGTIAVGIQMGMGKMHILFPNLFGDKDLEKIDPAMKAASLINPDLLKASLRSLEKIRPLMQSKLELEVYGMLLNTARALVTSSRDGYMALRKFYNAFSYSMPQQEFQELINPTNQTFKLLQAHFLVLQLTMTPVTKNEWEGQDLPRKRMTRNGVTARWFPSLHRDIPEDMKEYYEWTLWVEDEVNQGRIYNGVVKRDVEEEM